MSEKNTENDVLKICPFCGGEANEEYIKNRYIVGLVRCQTCGASSKAYSYYGDKDNINWEDYAFKKARAAWNRRISNV